MSVPTIAGVFASGFTTPPPPHPPMVRTGTTGTITLNTAGYLLTGFSDNTYAYLNDGKISGKWYWEAAGGVYTLFGVTDTPATARSFGGLLSNINAGAYAFQDTLWNQFGTLPAWSAGTMAGSVLGFALDVGAKTLAIYQNNVLGVILPLTSIALPIYPMFAFQSGPSSQVRLGAGNTVYAPPAGFSYF